MPEKHHYVPVFYLKRWADKDGDGRLCVYSRPYDQVKVNRKHPDATGYEYDLNAIRGADAETEGRLEGRFFLRADNDAARALNILETGRGDLMDASVRSAWSRFVMTLLHRNPERVAEWKSRAGRAAAWADNVRSTHATFPLKHPTLPRVADPRPSAFYAAKLAVWALEGVMENKSIGDLLNGMIWIVVPLEGSFSLLTSDRPLWISGPLANHDAFLAMPIGLRLLFIAANDGPLAHRLAKTDHDALTTGMNERVAAQACKFVWGLDDSQLSFVEQLIGKKLPMSPLDFVE
jgi:Protein of unknown function (DUF4238)